MSKTTPSTIPSTHAFRGLRAMAILLVAGTANAGGQLTCPGAVATA